MATIKFLGAAQEVTGSCHLLESPGTGKILLDCGMHQGGKAIERQEKEQFAFEPREIDAVVLSHAHLDHSGLLPKLVHEGFDGPIYCTKATSELLGIMLRDSYGLYKRDLERKNLRNKRRGDKPVKASYTEKDVTRALSLCEPKPYEQAFPISEQTRVTFHDAGHILGSAIVEISINEQHKTRSLVFSGDLGNRNAVLMNDPAVITKADVVMMEGTYGDRDHRSMERTIDQFDEILKATWQRGGNVMIPAFAVGRTQEILYYLGRLAHEGKLDNWQVVLDSPMAIEVTRIYDRWLHTLDCQGAKKLCDTDITLLKDFLPRLHLSVTPQESMAINMISKGVIIIAGSGMCTGGRIRHHFKHRIWNRRNTIIFTGFQARGTLGRVLVDGSKYIKMFGDDYVVKASIETLGGFSAHAGQTELVEWVTQFKNKPRVVLVHGEADALEVLSNRLWNEHEISPMIPARGQTLAF